MDLGDVLVVGAKRNGDLSIIKELESITNVSIGSRNVAQVGLKLIKEIMETLEVEVEFLEHKHIIWS